MHQSRRQATLAQPDHLWQSALPHILQVLIGHLLHHQILDSHKPYAWGPEHLEPCSRPAERMARSHQKCRCC